MASKKIIKKRPSNPNRTRTKPTKKRLEEMNSLYEPRPEDNPIPITLDEAIEREDREERESKKRGGKSRFIIGLFDEQPKAKLTDEQLADIIVTRFPDTADSNWTIRLVGLRRMYNNRQMVGQKAAPARPLVRFLKDGAAILARPGPRSRTRQLKGPFLTAALAKKAKESSQETPEGGE